MPYVVTVVKEYEYGACYGPFETDDEAEEYGKRIGQLCDAERVEVFALNDPTPDQGERLKRQIGG